MVYLLLLKWKGLYLSRIYFHWINLAILYIDRLSNMMGDHRLSNMMGDCLGKIWPYWSCKLSAQCQEDVCTMPNNFTAFGLKILTETRCLHAVCMLPAHCTYFAWDIVGCMVLSTQMDGFQTYVELGGFFSTCYITSQVLLKFSCSQVELWRILDNSISS